MPCNATKKNDNIRPRRGKINPTTTLPKACAAQFPIILRNYTLFVALLASPAGSSTSGQQSGSRRRTRTLLVWFKLESDVNAILMKNTFLLFFFSMHETTKVASTPLCHKTADSVVRRSASFCWMFFCLCSWRKKSIMVVYQE